jgi:hypothetical protein
MTQIQASLAVVDNMANSASLAQVLMQTGAIMSLFDSPMA